MVKLRTYREMCVCVSMYCMGSLLWDHALVSNHLCSLGVTREQITSSLNCREKSKVKGEVYASNIEGQG